MNFRSLLVLCLFSFFCNVIKAQPFPGFRITTCTPQSEGYYFTTVFKNQPGTRILFHLTIFDKNGEVVYVKKYHMGQLVSDFKLHQNGLMSFYFKDKFYLMDHTFTIVDSVFCKNGVSTNNHELLILENGHFIVIGIETIQMNLGCYRMWGVKSLPGSPTAKVKFGVIQELDKNKNVVFEWRSKNYFNFAEVDPYFLSDLQTVDLMHINALDVEKDGNLLVSLRYFNQIIKISRKDGTIIWRLGGKQNQFKFLNDNERFIGQHDIRSIKNGNITLFDNGRPGIPFHPASAKEYQLDEKKLTAKLVYKYTDNNRAYSSRCGNFQQLTNGNLLVNYGVSDSSQTLFNVIRPSGTKVFEIVFDDTLFSYRSLNYPTLPWQLKRPGVKSYEKDGKLYLTVETEYASYAWSTGGVSREIEINHEGNYSVFVPIGSDGFISCPTVVVGVENGRYKIRNNTQKNNQTK